MSIRNRRFTKDGKYVPSIGDMATDLSRAILYLNDGNKNQSMMWIENSLKIFDQTKDTLNTELIDAIKERYAKFESNIQIEDLIETKEFLIQQYLSQFKNNSN